MTKLEYLCAWHRLRARIAMNESIRHTQTADVLQEFCPSGDPAGVAKRAASIREHIAKHRQTAKDRWKKRWKAK